MKKANEYATTLKDCTSHRWIFPLMTQSIDTLTNSTLLNNSTSVTTEYSFHELVWFWFLWPSNCFNQRNCCEKQSHISKITAPQCLHSVFDVDVLYHFRIVALAEWVVGSLCEQLLDRCWSNFSNHKIWIYSEYGGQQ